MKWSAVWILVGLFSSQLVLAQPKPKQKEKAPTQKEMEEMMKEAQKAIDNLDPEEKRMMDSLGIKMPSFKEVPKVGDAALKKAFDDENRLVPLKDNARIGSIYKFPLTSSNISNFLSSTTANVAAKLGTQKTTQGEQAFQQAKASYHTSTGIGNAAVSFFVMGYPDIALYMQGKACAEDPSNNDNLNNYASMLSMSGGEQYAIPILESLNKKFPKNSTVLNNLGQAWFGLGEVDKATKYLDTVIRIYAYHPQANYTQSLIEESKGHDAAAVSHLINAMKYSYSKDKEDRLRKLGHKMESKDINWPFPKKANPLGLEGFRRPNVPSTVDEAIVLEKQWQEYVEDIERKEAQIQKSLEAAFEKVKQMNQKRIDESMSMVKASMSAGKPMGNLTLVPFYADKAAIKMKEFEAGKAGSIKYKAEEILKKMAAFQIDAAPREFAYNRKIEELDSLETEQTGEGLPNKSFCPKKKAVANELMAQYNPPLERMYQEYLKLQKEWLDERMNIEQYMLWPEEFEVNKLQAELYWLGLLKNHTIKFITEYKCELQLVNNKLGPLAEFDDVHCEYHSKLDLFAGSISVDCSRMTSTIDLGVFKGSLKQDMNKDNFKDQFMNCSVEVGISKSVGVERGPLKAEASVGAGLGMEFDRSGLKDVVIKAGAGVSAGAGPASVEAGMEGQISLISGASTLEGRGILQGR